MTIVDVLIILGLLVSIALGFRDGFMRKFFGILGFLIGLVAATKLMGPAGDLFVDVFGLASESAKIVAFSFVFVAFVILENLFYRKFGIHHSNILKISSRIAGAIVGIFQGAVAVSLVLIMFNIFQMPSAETKENSLLYKPIFVIAPAVFDYATSWLPESKAFLDELKEHFEHLNPTH
jgi:membrane protein required for colicin V production